MHGPCVKISMTWDSLQKKETIGHSYSLWCFFNRKGSICDCKSNKYIFQVSHTKVQFLKAIVAKSSESWTPSRISHLTEFCLVLRNVKCSAELATICFTSHFRTKKKMFFFKKINLDTVLDRFIALDNFSTRNNINCLELRRIIALSLFKILLKFLTNRKKQNKTLKGWWAVICLWS